MVIVSIDVGVCLPDAAIVRTDAAELRVLPAVPLGAFLLLLAGGYIICFTVAGGQTIGKMAPAIRVVPIDGTRPRQRARRAGERCAAGRRLSGIASCTAGLGFLPALFSHDHRALHDRLADTRVVRA